MSRTALTERMKSDLPGTRVLYRIGPTMRAALAALARGGTYRSRRALAEEVARTSGVSPRQALYSIAALAGIGLVLDAPVRPSDVGWRYVKRLEGTGD